MPLSVQDIFDLPYYTPPVRVVLEPGRSALQSLVLLSNASRFPGVSDWVTNTLQAMSRAERRTNDLVMIGFHFATVPQESWNSFTAYIDHLAALNPQVLVDRMLDVYDAMTPWSNIESGILDREAALISPENYLTYLYQRFPPENVDETIERQAYTYVIDPPAFQKLMVDHLRAMWNKYLSAEWQRVRPMLEESVRAFHQLDLKSLSFMEAARVVTGQNLNSEKWERQFAEARRLVFVPHAHVGPYLMKLCTRDGELLLFFGARLPEGSALDVPDLSRNEIVVRLSALADDTRLRILRLIAENGEQRSQEIMDALDLSQSAASRHLTQLSAAGYLTERRCEGAKCYALNPDRVTDTMQAIEKFLLVGERSAV